jgi:hypothetical protein
MPEYDLTPLVVVAVIGLPVLVAILLGKAPSDE